MNKIIIGLLSGIALLICVGIGVMLGLNGRTQPAGDAQQTAEQTKKDTELQEITGDAAGFASTQDMAERLKQRQASTAQQKKAATSFQPGTAEALAATKRLDADYVIQRGKKAGVEVTVQDVEAAKEILATSYGHSNRWVMYYTRAKFGNRQECMFLLDMQSHQLAVVELPEIDGNAMEMRGKIRFVHDVKDDDAGNGTWNHNPSSNTNDLHDIQYIMKISPDGKPGMIWSVNRGTKNVLYTQAKVDAINAIRTELDACLADGNARGLT